MKWNITREQPNTDWKDGDPLADRTVFAPFEVYDDAAGPVQDHMDELQAERGVCFGASLIKEG